ncbi:MAG: hypothetical protein PHN80_05295 [Hespellia sp.]|nr:hypothetical protein [Hespellia sp.]
MNHDDLIYNEKVACIVDQAIIQYIIRERELEIYVKTFIDFLIENIELLVAKDAAEDEKILLMHLIYYLKYVDNNKWETLIPYTEDLFEDNEVNKYYQIQIKQFCFKKDYSDFLLNKNNIRRSPYWEIEKMLDVSYNVEIELYNAFSSNNKERTFINS